MLVGKSSKKYLGHQESGYTLIQVALSILVLGVLATVFIQVYEMYNQTQKAITTQENIATVVQKIHTYRQSFGIYPCPAPMNVARDSAAPLYGEASDYDAFLPTSATTPLNIGDCGSGICIESTNRGGAIGVVRVRVGAVPFRDMQLDEEKTFDGYGSRLWYAVSEDMCNLNTFQDTKGGINIVNELGEAQTNPAGSAAFIVISPGINKVGGYSKSGVIEVACNGTTDTQNCRDVATSPQADTDATYLLTSTANPDAANTYDDVVEYFSSSVNQLWRRTSPTSEDIIDMSNNSVGIGESSPIGALDITQTTVNTDTGNMATLNTTGANLQNGALRLSQAGMRLTADKYCDETGNNCFRVENITGDIASGTGGIKCPNATEYPVGITSDGTDAKFVCISDLAIKCPVGKVFNGLTNVAGKLVPSCTDSNLFASCPAQNVTFCTPNDVALPNTAHNLITNYFNRGDCAYIRYRCNNGNWEIWDSGGQCAAVISSENRACGDCWAGNYTITHNGCLGDSNNFATACTCDASVGFCKSISYPGCPPASPSGDGGEIHYNKICNPADLTQPAFRDPADTGTVIRPPNCSCTKLSYNEFYSCNAGYIRDAAAAPPTPGADASTNAWPADITKGKYQHKEVDATCSYVNSGPIVDACVCDTTDRYSASLANVPACKKPKAGSRNYGGQAFDWKDDVMKSSIDNLAACTFGPAALEDPAQFEDLQLYWREITGGPLQYGVGANTNLPRVNDPCDCATIGQNTEKVCQKANATGSYDNYKCRCSP